MPRRIRRRPLYLDLHLPGMSRRAKLLVILTVVLSIIAAVTIRSIAYFRELSCQMAVRRHGPDDALHQRHDKQEVRR